jgi:NDP-sugar pyrophosphorylase family protein
MSGDGFELGSWPVAILAGGMGTRLRPAAEKIPKALIPVAGQPFLAHQLRLLHGSGIHKVVLCVGYRGEMIEREFGDGGNDKMELSYSFDGPELLGTGGALKKALPLLGDRFFVLYGDSYLPINYAAPAHAFVNSGKLALMTVFRNEGRWDNSNVWFQNGAIKNYSKEEQTGEMQHIDYGLGVLSSAALADWPDGKTFDLAEVYCDLISRNELAGLEIGQRFYEVGSPQGLGELDALLRSQQLLRAP